MKDSNAFHRAFNTAKRFFKGWKLTVSKSHTYPDPVLQEDPHLHPSSGRYHSPKAHRKPVLQGPLASPPSIPGTITYQDRLVAHLGYDRRAADTLLAAWRKDPNIPMPRL